MLNRVFVPDKAGSPCTLALWVAKKATAARPMMIENKDELLGAQEVHCSCGKPHLNQSIFSGLPESHFQCQATNPLLSAQS